MGRHSRSCSSCGGLGSVGESTKGFAASGKKVLQNHCTCCATGRRGPPNPKLVGLSRRDDQGCCITQFLPPNHPHRMTSAQRQEVKQSRTESRRTALARRLQTNTTTSDIFLVEFRTTSTLIIANQHAEVIKKKKSAACLLVRVLD